MVAGGYSYPLKALQAYVIRGRLQLTVRKYRSPIFGAVAGRLHRSPDNCQKDRRGRVQSASLIEHYIGLFVVHSLIPSLPTPPNSAMLHSIYDLTTFCRKTTGDIPAKLVVCPLRSQASRFLNTF